MTEEQEKTPETENLEKKQELKETETKSEQEERGVTEGAKPLNSREDASKKPSGVLDKDNTIFVGIKPFMNYVTGVVMQFKTKGQEEVIVSARGKFISKAVDITEVARRTFLKEENIQVKDIKISSEAFENKEGKRINVSAIEIVLVKG